MRVRFIGIGIVFFMLCSACQPGETKKLNGIEYRVVRNGRENLPKEGDMVLFNARVIDSNDSVWLDTYTDEMLAGNLVGDSSRIDKERFVKKLFRTVRIGDSIVFDIPVDVYFKEVVAQPFPKGVDPSLSLSYHIKVEKMMNLETYIRWMKREIRRKVDKKVNEEGRTIDKFLGEKGVTAQTDISGLRYVITSQTSSEKVKPGQTVLVNYSGYLLNGRCFTTTIKSVAVSEGIFSSQENYLPKKFVVGEFPSSAIVGLHDAVKLLGKGDRGVFYIPSPLGFVNDDRTGAPYENAIVFLDVEVVSVE